MPGFYDPRDAKYCHRASDAKQDRLLFPLTKFSAVLGATSARNSKVILPTSSPPTSMSKYTAKVETAGIEG